MRPLKFYWHNDFIFWPQDTQVFGLQTLPRQHMDITGTLTKPDSRRFPYILCQVFCVPGHLTVFIPIPEKTPPPSLPYPNWWGMSICRTPMGREQQPRLHQPARMLIISIIISIYYGLKLYVTSAEQNLQSLARGAPAFSESQQLTAFSLNLESWKYLY